MQQCLPVLSVCHKARKNSDSVFFVGYMGAWCCVVTFVVPLQEGLLDGHVER